MKVQVFQLPAKRIAVAALAIWFLLGSICTSDLVAQQSGRAQDVASLLQVEEKVEQVVAKNMNACVSISTFSSAEGASAGSGVIVTKSGLILTAGHVMVGQGEYDVLFPDGRTARATPLGKNLDIDAGMLQIIDPGPWPYVKIGKSKSLKKGDWVVSLGHSGGFELGRKPPVRTGRVLDFNETQIVTDAVLIGGDSGGPLFDLDGKLVGIHSSIGDSIAENRHVLTELFAENYDRMKRGEQWGQLPTLHDQNDGSKPPKMGVVIDKKTGRINSVRRNSPAWDAGIEVGDVAFEFNGIPLNDGSQLIDLVRQKISGDVVTLKMTRGDRVLVFEVRLR